MVSLIESPLSSGCTVCTEPLPNVRLPAMRARPLSRSAAASTSDALAEPASTSTTTGASYRFSDAELAVYGEYELQTLERVLRELDASCSDAIELSVDLLTSRGDWRGVAAVLDRGACGFAAVRFGTGQGHPKAPMAVVVSPPTLSTEREEEVVAYAFGFAASSFFPVIVLGIFWRRATREGAVAGMISGMLVTSLYLTWFVVLRPDLNGPAHWLFGISPEGFGAVGALVNGAMLVIVSLLTDPPPEEVQRLVASLRYPREARR